jgi:hypothetical protein
MKDDLPFMAPEKAKGMPEIVDKSEMNNQIR